MSTLKEPNNTDNSQSYNSNKYDRFTKISEKIAQIQHTDIQNNPQKFLKIEQKINEVEDNLLSNIESLEQKYALLKDQMTKFTKIVEEQKMQKEKMKSKTNEEIKSLENKIKTLLLEEREYMKNYVDSCFKKLEGNIQNFEKESREENESIKKTVQGLKEFMNIELPNMNSKIEGENEDRIKTIQSLVNEMNSEFGRVHELVYTF